MYYFASILGFLLILNRRSCFVSPCHSNTALYTNPSQQEADNPITPTSIIFTRLAAKLSQSHPSIQTQKHLLENTEASRPGRLFRGLRWNIVVQTSSSPVLPPLLTVKTEYPKILNLCEYLPRTLSSKLMERSICS